MRTFLFLSMFPLAMLRAEHPSTTLSSRVAFAQYCFWTGEMELGQIAGVLRTEAGYFQGREVRLVDYDPAQVSLESLARRPSGRVLQIAFTLAPASKQKARTLKGKTRSAA